MDGDTVLPTSWIIVKVQDVGTSMTGNTPSTQINANYGSSIPYIKPPQLTDQLLDSSKSYLSEQGAKLARVLPAYSVLVSCIGNLGKTGLNKIPVAFNQQINAIVPFKGIAPSYLFYQAQSIFFRNQLESKATATTISIVNKGNFETIRINLAPLPEQHRIVAKIEELFSELDKGVESLKTARAQLKIYRQALLKNAFEGKLTADMNKGIWPQKSLNELLDYLTSGSRGWSSYYAAEGDLFIRAQNIKHDRLELDDIAFVALPERAEGLRSRVQKGDLLITVTGANVTKSAVIENDVGVAYVSQHVALCRPSKEVFPKFLYWFIIAESAGRKQLNKMAYGAGKPGLSLENIRTVVVSLPSLVEQKKIVELIETKLSEADQLDQTITTALQQADALRQSILKKAFSGQLVAQDPSDEPAAALLARIKREAK